MCPLVDVTTGTWINALQWASKWARCEAGPGVCLLDLARFILHVHMRSVLLILHDVCVDVHMVLTVLHIKLGFQQSSY